MSRNILKSSATVLAATAATGALVLGTPGLASAATYHQGYSNDERSVSNGTGDADARANSNDRGRLNVYTQARGGSATDPVGGTTSTPTSANANASLNKRVQVAKGTYRVVVVYRGIQGNERDRGNDSQAKVVRKSVVQYSAQTGGGDRRVQRVQQVPSRKSTQRTKLLITVPQGSSGFLRVKGALQADSNANGGSNFAQAEASTSKIVLKVNRV